MSDDKFLAEMKRRAERESEIGESLGPSIPDITRFIMAGDIRQGQDALEQYKDGHVDLKRAFVLTGSYGRMPLLLALLDQRLINWDEASDLLVEWWSSSDPDDTDRRLIDLWYHAFRKRNRLVTDGDDLPPGRYLSVYRGQRFGDPLGCAWSLSRHVAETFAKGASFRTAIAHPQLIEARVARVLILAYITGRGEQEVIIDPRGLAVLAGDDNE